MMMMMMMNGDLSVTVVYGLHFGSIRHRKCMNNKFMGINIKLKKFGSIMGFE